MDANSLIFNHSVQQIIDENEKMEEQLKKKLKDQ